MARKQRLDVHLLQLGLVNSRQQAQQLIRAGNVRDSYGQLLDKPSLEVSSDMIPLVEYPPRFVSRGGEKLDAALKAFSILTQGRVCLDGGISTGGFSDCLFQNGASRIYGVDVGYGQTAWKLRNDSRLVLKERTNLRNLKVKDLYLDSDPLPDLAVVDVSFISLVLILPALKRLILYPSAEAIVLIKPQFEVGKEQVGKGGVVREAASHVEAIKRVIAAALTEKWQVIDIVASPITGPAGNHEYLLWLSGPEYKGRKKRRKNIPFIWEALETLVQNTIDK
uniref:Hemolysin A n=1 Tax=Paulinella chromatophora TaxID=39717 RepID=B1X3X0_PAUCH|nr:Hemolysin A [Paulinella chromatophora]ACB42639.1 Hemolysin A [Paulinella chromatophora]